MDFRALFSTRYSITQVISVRAAFFTLNSVIFNHLSVFVRRNRIFNCLPDHYLQSINRVKEVIFTIYGIKNRYRSYVCKAHSIVV